jgi:hypothetical protein
MHHLRSAHVSSAAVSASFSHGQTQSSRSLKNLDQLAGEVRDSAQLAEPLADSVLEYSLRRLRPAAHHEPSRTRQEVNNATLEDQLDELLEDIPRASQPSTACTDFGNEERMDANTDGGNPHALTADPALFANMDGDSLHVLAADPTSSGPMQLFETFEDNMPLLMPWDMWRSTFSHPSQPNYNPFGSSGDV